MVRRTLATPTNKRVMKQMDTTNKTTEVTLAGVTDKTRSETVQRPMSQEATQNSQPEWNPSKAVRRATSDNNTINKKTAATNNDKRTSAL